MGADFIESHYTTSWGIADNKLLLDDVGIPLIGIKNVGMVRNDNHSPVVAKCTVKQPARHQAVIPMRSKDKSCKSGLFEPTKTPGGSASFKDSSVVGQNYQRAHQGCS